MTDNSFEQKLKEYSVCRSVKSFTVFQEIKKKLEADEINKIIKTKKYLED